jgi:hypothetical protein
MQEIYESTLVKHCLQDPILSAKIVNVHRKIFRAFSTQSPEKYRRLVREWVIADSSFPVNQKDRDWRAASVTLGGHQVNPYVLMDYAGIQHDPTAVPLSGDFMKHLALSDLIDVGVSNARDKFMRSVLERVRGFRTNRKKRFESAKSKKYVTEPQVGIANFDKRSLVLDGRYYETEPWMHPGRSKCDTSQIRGAFQKTADQHYVPIACSVSGSTNFWIWTALASNVDLSENEVRLLILSAYLTLASDGGHNLQEVLSSATMTSIYLDYYAKFSNSTGLLPYLDSQFVTSLAQVTKMVNPIGYDVPAATDETIARTVSMLFRDPSMSKYGSYFDRNVVEEHESHEEEEKRVLLEQLFVDNRQSFRFADYGVLLNGIPGIEAIRARVIADLREYRRVYCTRD